MAWVLAVPATVLTRARFVRKVIGKMVQQLRVHNVLLDTGTAVMQRMLKVIVSEPLHVQMEHVQPDILAHGPARRIKRNTTVI